MREFSRFIFRPTPTPGQDIPLGIRGVGHRCFAPGEGQRSRALHWVTLHWVVSGMGRVDIEGETSRLSPGSLILFFPGEATHYFAEKKIHWEFRWCSLDGPSAINIVEALGFRRGVVYWADLPPQKLFATLFNCVRDISRSGELLAGATAYRLLSHVAAHARQRKITTRKVSSFDFTEATLRLLHSSWDDPSFGVEQLADELGMNRTVLARRFRQIFGLAPSEYLHRWRIQNALTRLKETRLPIAEIATNCGWSDQNYFARSIRKATGQSPSEFRRNQ